MNGGDDFKLETDSEILSIKSPQNQVGGPYIVVSKNVKERWAIVAMDWENHPCLGIRWFHGGGGTPISSAYPIWLVIPESLTKGVLFGLPLKHKLSNGIDEFLAGKLDGNELKKQFQD